MFSSKTENVINGAAQALKYVYAFNMDTQEIIVVRQRSWFRWHKCATDASPSECGDRRSAMAPPPNGRPLCAGMLNVATLNNATVACGGQLFQCLVEMWTTLEASGVISVNMSDYFQKWKCCIIEIA